MWQQFLKVRTSAHANPFAFLSRGLVDVDPNRVRPFAADRPFLTVVDCAGQLGRLFQISTWSQTACSSTSKALFASAT